VIVDDGLTLRPFFWRPTHLFRRRDSSRGRTTASSRVPTASSASASDRCSRRSPTAASATGIESGRSAGTTTGTSRAYYAAPLSGAQLHTINVQLGDDDITYIVEDADDDVPFVDPGEPFETIERLWDELAVNEVVVMGEAVPDTTSTPSPTRILSRGVRPARRGRPPRPRGGLPRGDVLHFGNDRSAEGRRVHPQDDLRPRHDGDDPAGLGIEEGDVVMPVVPMFHANSWEFPYAATMAGARRRSIPVRHRARRTCSS